MFYGKPVNRSGTLNGSSQDLAAAWAGRRYLRVHNPSTNEHSFWVNDTGDPATATKDCIEVPPGAGFVMSAATFVSTAKITIIGTSGETWHAAEAGA